MLIPAAPAHTYAASSLPTTGRLDPTPCAAAAGAWKEAIVGWLRSRRPCAIAVGRAAAMSCGSAASVERIRRPTSSSPRGAAGEWRIPKCAQGHKSPSAGAGRQPPGREALRAPQGLPRRSLRGGLLGLGDQPRGCRSRHPRPVFGADTRGARESGDTGVAHVDHQNKSGGKRPATRVAEGMPRLWKQEPHRRIGDASSPCAS
jgi:hypothetical protein